jgi:hypothetical protein
MVDYDRDIGSVTLRIRDYGSLVEFWILPSTGTYNYAQPWSWNVNGASGSGIFRLEKTGMWQRMGRFTVTVDQNVRFSVQNSGIGFGDYDFVQHIDRIDIPPAPAAVHFDSILDTSLRALFSSRGDGGSAILEWQIGYGTNRYTPQHYVASSGTTTITGLVGGTIYYFWARGRNAIGWSPWSARSQVTTDRIPDQPNPVVFSEVAQNSVRATANYRGRWDGGSPILEWQIGYSLLPASPSTMVSGANIIAANLQVAATYYFWSRVRNALGWSPWSTRSSVTLFGGAYIKSGNIQHRAVPWVKVGGVWKVAKPYNKFNGVWRVAR